MRKIKIVGIVIFILSILLVVISLQITKQNKIKTNMLELINAQKTLVQSISKNTFYSYRQKSKSKTKDISTTHLDESINQFLINIGKKEHILNKINSLETIKQADYILDLWDKFYLDIVIYKRQIRVTIPYTNVLLEKTVSRIFTKNINLVLNFDKLINIQKDYFDEFIYTYKQMQYIILILISIFTLYLFTQINIIISFVQQFLQTSKRVIEDNSIENIEIIEVNHDNQEIKDATNNFNTLVNKINTSILYSSESISNTSKSLHMIEKNIEEFLILLNNMNNEEVIDINLTKKEDAVIDSLDELMNLTNKLDKLKINLDKLIHTHK